MIDMVDMSTIVTAEDVAEATGRDVDEVREQWKEIFGSGESNEPRQH